MAIISHRKKFRFLRTEKTASSSISKAFDRLVDEKTGRVHDGAYEVGKLPGYFTFAFVRNPWERLVSWYDYMKDQEETKHVINMTFPEFLHWHLPGRRSQWKFVHYEDGSPVDFIGRYEFLRRDFLHICKKLKVMVPLPYKNYARRKVSWKTYYDKDSVEYVREMCSEDVKGFGYKYD